MKPNDGDLQASRGADHDGYRCRWRRGVGLLGAAVCLLTTSVLWAQGPVTRPQAASPTTQAATQPTSRPAAKEPRVRMMTSLEQTRLTMDKWIETQQLINRERNDWQQAKENLVARIDLLRKENAVLEEKIKETQTVVDQTNKKRDALTAENNQLKATSTQLTKSVVSMEGQTRRLFKMLPEPLQTKIQPFYQRIPAELTTTQPTTAKSQPQVQVAVAERYQNILVILGEVNKANSEITVNYEVHTLASGKSAEVQAIYVGLAQAYYVSAGGEAGISHPTSEGWKWEPCNTIARDLLSVLEMIQGKQTPAFVPLPVKIQ